MKIHELKIKYEYYQEIKRDLKRFEVRKNDRDFKEGDFVVFNTISNLDNESLRKEREIYRIGYVLDGFEGLAQGYVAFTIIKTHLHV